MQSNNNIKTSIYKFKCRTSKIKIQIEKIILLCYDIESEHTVDFFYFDSGFSIKLGG